MGIPEKDQKILWGKSAGRCSMPGCRKKVAIEASENIASKNILIGEVCHIVAEKEGGPRGKSSLIIDERSRYPNLILLCRNHHIEIDQDPEKWPIEKLHQIKSEHEIWVESQLTAIKTTREDELYSTLVNSATDSLFLSSWEGISDHAIRGILPREFVEEASSFGVMVFKTNWPGAKPDLEKAIIELANRVDVFIQHFLTLAILKGDRFFVEDKTWKRTWRQDFDKYAERSKKWQEDATNLLMNVLVALNNYADIVRQHLNPDYFFLQGTFTVFDSMGVTNEMKPIHYKPEKYIEGLPEKPNNALPADS